MRRDLLLAAAGLAGALGLALAAGGQPPAVAPPSAAEPAPTAGRYVGAPSCASSNCHGSTRPRRVFDVLQNEHFTWYKSDPHYTKAYPALFNERSAAIARNLHLPSAPAESAVCLGCHALVVPKAKQAGRLEIEDGISCEACHGPASGWIEGHSAEDWTHERSVAAGMTDLRDLGVRSDLCLSCHLGAADKTVDHELIAAGHPVLAFELDNYSEDMPAHWMPFRDKQRQEGLRDTHGVRAWAVGQAAGFRAGLDQLARHARSQHWPELSEMRCDACHHALSEQRWRTSRSPDRPGLPRWSPARWAVLRHLIGSVAPEARAGLDADVATLAQQVARLGTPPAAVAETAGRLSGALAPLVVRLDQAAWDDAQLRRLLLAIAGDGDLAADRATALQGFLAANTLVAALQARDPRRIGAGLAGTLDSLQQEFDNEYAWNAERFADRLAQLRRQAEGLP